MYTINVKEIITPAWQTEPHKLKKAFNDGKVHAENHFYGVELDPFWQGSEMKSWAMNPYPESRPDVFYQWLSGFCYKWGELNNDKTTND